MKRFRFRLDQVLHVRRVQEDRARSELLTANRDAHLAAARVEERLADYAAPEHPARPAVVRRLRTGGVPARLRRRRRRRRPARRTATRSTVVEARRVDWTDARRKVAALERLEERRRAEHAIEVQRAEDQLVDDLVVARHARGARA